MPATKTPATPIKKSASVKQAKAIKTRTIKYLDKSLGQPELVVIFNKIKELMKPYVKGTMIELAGQPGMYHLISKKAIEVEGRKKPEVYFVSIMVQKGFVGFYFMPIYMNDPMNKKIHPDLLKCLKGKACFHIKKDSPAMLEHIKDALKVGYEAYEQRGWV